MKKMKTTAITRTTNASQIKINLSSVQDLKQVD